MLYQPWTVLLSSAQMPEMTLTPSSWFGFLWGPVPPAVWLVGPVANLAANCCSCLQRSDFPTDQLFAWLERSGHWPGPYLGNRCGSTDLLHLLLPSLRMAESSPRCTLRLACVQHDTYTRQNLWQFYFLQERDENKSTTTLQFSAHALCHKAVEIVFSIHFLASNYYWPGTSGSPHVPKAQSR